VTDGTGKVARKAGKMHMAAGIIKIHVAPEWRRRGVGKFLIDTTAEALFRKYSQKSSVGRLRVHATINEEWLAGLNFLKGCGLRTPKTKDDAIRHRPFGDGCEADGIVMERFTRWPAPAVLSPLPPE
jgi:GNAT superfamily N-acetyltransferase